MEVISLQSGSNGNSYYIAAGDQQLMFDAGISGSVAEQRLGEHGRDIRKVSSLFITHDHSDHSRCMGIFHRKFGHRVHITERTYKAARKSSNLGRIDDVQFFLGGETIQVGDVSIHTLPTPHDSVDGVVFIVEHDDKRVGILTDLGHVFPGLRDVLLSLDAVIIESNYDPEMLDHGRYPENLKRRIRGPGGHISNVEAAELLRDSVFFNRLRWACLCHLSEDNNCPNVAVETHQRILGHKFPIHIAERHRSTGILEI